MLASVISLANAVVRWHHPKGGHNPVKANWQASEPANLARGVFMRAAPLALPTRRNNPQAAR